LFGKVVKDWPANRSTPISVLSFNAFPASPVMTTHKLRGTSSAPAEAFEKGSRLCYLLMATLQLLPSPYQGYLQPTTVCSQACTANTSLCSGYKASNLQREILHVQVEM